MNIKNASISDVPTRVSLSKEYDKYVLQLVPTLAEWYDGNEVSTPFDAYMRAKIGKGEAFIAVDEDDNCCGIVAISKSNNAITFFAVSHKCAFERTGDSLLDCALSRLNPYKTTTANIIKSAAKHIEKQRALFHKYDFIFCADSVENGVPVSCLQRLPSHNN